MNNKFLIVLIVLSLSLAAFLAGYLISQKDFTRQSANIGGGFLEKFDESQPSDLENSSGNLSALSKRAVLSPTLSKEKSSVLYYDKSNGRVFEAGPRDMNPERNREGPQRASVSYGMNERIVSDKPLPNLVETLWSPNKKEVVSVFDTNNGKDFRYYNYQTNKVVGLGKTIRSLAFSPDGSHIAYLRSLGLDGAIYVSSPDGSSPRKVIDTRLADIKLSWPSEEYISFKASVDGRDSVYLLSLTGNLTKFVDEPGKVDVLWSSGGVKILYSTRESGRPMLFIKPARLPDDTQAGGDALSSSVKALDISTPAYKCAWGINSDYIFCAVGRSGQGGEDIYKINMDGTKELLFSPAKNISAKQLMLTGTENFLIILNETDGKLYALKIAVD
ncbi:MAG: hypothetical protein HYT67_01150 [Candidatus Yanofskybacteria bacterium]|nr:hypothetical protein [Candidatus Yanofskybacteria bacterium]